MISRTLTLSLVDFSRRLASAGLCFICLGLAVHSAQAASLLLVSEYASGNLRAFDPATGAETNLPAHYSPVGGNSSGADGMSLDSEGRLLVNRGDGTIWRRSADGNSFAQFADTGAEYLLDSTRTDTHLFAAQFGENLIWRIALSNAAVSSIAGPPAANRFDGVRIGPDGRLYAVDSQNGNLFAYNLTSSSWSTFLTNPLAGEASQMEFGADGRVFLSRTIGGQARLYSYTLNTSGDYSSGLNPSSQTLIGGYGSFGAATGIRIGPDGRLYANAFNAGEVWRSTIGITAMEGTAFVTGLQEPGSIYFEADDDPPALPGVLVDFGRDVLTVASPDANGRWWNNVATDDALPPSGSFSNLVNATNGMTAISISVSGFGAGANTNGATSPAAALGDLAIANATRDSFFVASGNTATITLSGLDSDSLYRLECFGSRDAADARSTRFTAAGLSSTSATVQTSGAGIGLAPEANANRAGLAVLEEVQPTALGGIVLSVAVDSGSFGYLGALHLLRTGTATSAPPETVRGVVLVDLGHDAAQTASPDSNGRTWNNLSTDSSAPPAGAVNHLLTVSNAATTIAIAVSGFGGGANTNGATSPDAALGDLAIADATRDSFFVASGNTATVTFSGLEPDRLYRLECFGSRDAVDARSTRFTATGLSSTSATVQTSGTGIGLAPEPNANRASLAVIEEFQPTSLGGIVLSVQVASGSFGYLGALRLEPLGEVGSSNFPPTAANVQWIGAPAVGRTLAVLYKYADANGDPEGNSLIEWQRDVPPFTNAATLQSGTNRTFVLSAQPGDYLRVAVTPLAASGAATGTVAYSSWKGPIAASNALTVFHIGNSFTRWGHIPLQLRQLASDAGFDHAFGEQLADGMGLAYHWTNGLPGGVITRGTPARAELATGSWDVLVLQPMSREWQSDRIDDFTTYADLFAQLAATNGTRVFLYNYWPYLSEALSVQDDIDAAFETVRAALASNGVDVAILPAGAAFRTAAEQAGTGAFTNFTRADLYQDDYHPSDEGYYLSALVHFAALHRESPVGRTNGALSAAESHDDPVWIDADLAAAFQQIAWDVARQHPQSGVARGRFDAWAAALPEGSRGLLDDRHGDGLPNLVRWALGIGPGDDDYFERLLTVTPNASGRDWIRFRLGADAEDAGVSVSVEWSPELTEWFDELPAGTAFNRTGEQVEIIPSAAWTNVYLRLRVRLPGEETP